MTSAQPIAIHWFRRDLRLEDNTALYEALMHHTTVLPIFIFDTQILDELPRADKRVVFIHDTLTQLDARLRAIGSGILCLTGKPLEVWQTLLQTYTISAVYTNRDYEPYARQRDAEVYNLLEAHHIPMHVFKDHVVREMDDVLKDDGTPYTVYTPYSNRWKRTLPEDAFEAKPSEQWLRNCVRMQIQPLPTLTELGFQYIETQVPSVLPDNKIIAQY
ncbi:MAG TPA: deoxyribodipyrimidine photo-lyase, partial [Chitinophagales bacterium]|nr:deoxyribodipyrimidine photo-lyase [Chitinophagales bacterium]